MKKNSRLQWIANFDMESLVSNILRSGILLSVGLIVAVLAAHACKKGAVDFGEHIQARSITHLLKNDLYRMKVSWFHSPTFIHLSIAVLMLTPYARVVASMVYFAGVERHWKHALLTGIVLIILTIVLLTDLV